MRSSLYFRRISNNLVRSTLNKTKPHRENVPKNINSDPVISTTKKDDNSCNQDSCDDDPPDMDIDQYVPRYFESQVGTFS